jgi:RND family efflux transporter MFP subunit
VTKRHIEVGETVQPSQQVMSGVSLEKLRVKVAIPQRLIHAVRSLGKARAFVSEPGAEAIEATKLTFFPYADGRTNTFDVRVELPEGITGLFPGMFVKVGFVTGEKRQLVVPIEAVVYRSEVTGVYVVRSDKTVAFRHIRQGRPTGDGEIEVLAGLEAGERVALQPIQAGAYIKTAADVRGNP